LRSFEVGMSQIDEIAAEFAGELGRAQDLASYLRNFHYRLGPEEMRGLEEFRRLVLERDLLRPM
jgi:predicted solute-binding protein